MQRAMASLLFAEVGCAKYGAVLTSADRMHLIGVAGTRRSIFLRHGGFVLVQLLVGL